MGMMRVKASVVAACVVTACIVLAVSSGAGVDLQSASVVWLFDEGAGDIARDLTGNGNDGTLFKNPKWVDGKFGGALEFDGGVTYVEVAEPVGLPLQWAPRTVMLWFKSGAVGAQRANVIGYGPINSPGWFGVFIAPGVLGYENTDWRVQFIADWRSDGDWHHFVVAFPDGERTKIDQLKLYLDGEPLNGEMLVGVKPNILLTAAGRLRVAADSRDNVYFKGIVDDVAIFPRELTPEEIALVMQNGLLAAQDVSPQEKLATAWGSIKAH